MNVRSAAKLINCSWQTVGRLIRAGRLKARKVKVKSPYGKPMGFVYDITPKEIERFKQHPRDPKLGGWTMGKLRKPKRKVHNGKV